MNSLYRIEGPHRGAVVAALAVCLIVAGALAQTTAPASQPSAPKKTDAQANGGPRDVVITRPGTFEIHVQGADLRGVLQLLSTQGKRNIVATKDVRGTVTADLYGVSFDQALNAILQSTGFDYIEEEGLIYIYTTKQKEALLKAKIKVEVQVFKLSHLRAADAQVLVAPALSPQGSIAVTPAAIVGLSPSKTTAGGDSLANADVLVVRDYKENLDKIEQLIKELDVRPEQVLIEATILSAQLREGDKLGMNFNVLGGVDFQDLGVTATTSGTPSFTPGNISTKDITALNFRTDFTPVQKGFSFGIFGSDIAFLVSALQSITDTTVLANPKLLVINKQKGEVMVGRRDGYLTTTVTETTATQTVEFLETGTRLIVRPFIAKDGYIRMEVHPEDSSGQVENSLPSETTTEVTTNVLVRDGHTIVIGGLFRENSSNGRQQVPLLGNIPYLGSLFRTTDDLTERNEVIILLTPHVISHPEASAAAEEARDDIERFRMGQRAGLRCWSNERLAQTFFRRAKEALREGNQERALWDLDMALSMRPQFLEAIRLKERLTQKACWADQGRVSSVRYLIQRMMMDELGKPADPVIPSDRPRNGAGLDPAVRKVFGIEPYREAPLPEPVKKVPASTEGGPK